MSLFSTEDVDSFRSDRLEPVQRLYFPKATFTDAYLLQQIKAAEQECGTKLKIPFEPTMIFPSPPSDAQVTALDGEPYFVEPGYDYDPEFFQGERWGYIVTRKRPIIRVVSINLVYPNPTSTVFAIPLDWLRIDYKYGHIRMVPASSQFLAPLGAFLMQALGGGQTIPSMIQLQYEAGLQAAHDNDPQLIDVILKLATLKILQGTYRPASGSISVDGMSQSLSIKIADMKDDIDRDLFGTKGSNGGLWTHYQGVANAMIGMIA